MKKFTLFLLASLLFTLANCNKDKTTDEPVCTGNCLFTMKDAAGTIIKMDCFNRYAIKAHRSATDSTFIYGVPDALDTKFEEVGKTVTFSGTFRENTLTPTFPDPSFPAQDIYQMDISSIK